jgi:hypothetical protein
MVLGISGVFATLPSLLVILFASVAMVVSMRLLSARSLR